ncbi:uncharacterized protein LOC18009369 [Eutrema salsugineum]|uniref:uncharacterized protein LOC18009369 n=1 Tax=Eutrema salsugineum TaxID=72664 RepID=UPI000CED48F2|nr:uncharacterized protein LOC18009369 [Eutrema salsugineum]
MPKESRIMSVTSNGTRVSPYPLRASRTKKQKAVESPIQTEGAREWEDVRCVICMEPPHNAVLLQCTSSYKGCRPYMCDTSARHSNCFKQYRRNKGNRLDTKTLKCPFCRGEVFETIKVSGARRFMNAKPRSCSFEDCDFSGTYSQLNNHLKTDHPGFIPLKVDPQKQMMWEQMQRDAEYIELMTAAGLPHSPPEPVHRHHPPPHPHPMLQLSLQSLISAAPRQVRSGFGVATLMPRLEIRTMTMFHGWNT